MVSNCGAAQPDPCCTFGPPPRCSLCQLPLGQMDGLMTSFGVETSLFLHIAFTLAPKHNTSHCILQVSTLVFLYVHGQTSLAPLPAGPASLSPRKPPQKMKEQSVPVSPLAPLPRPPPFAQAGCGAPQPGQQLAGNRLPGPPIQQQMMAGCSESAPSVIAPYQPARIPPLCRLRQAGSSAPPGHPAAH